MGGASMQAAFDPKTTVLESEFQFPFLGIYRSIFAKSWMLFGQNEAKNRFYESLLEASPDADPVQNPCFLKGDNETIVMFAGTKKEKTVHFTGSGNPSSCKSYTR